MTELQDNPLRDLNNARNLPRTPETDNLARGNHVVPTEWAEQLEREKNEAQATLTDIHRWIERNHPDGFIDSQTWTQNLERVTDRWYERLDQVERERDEARAELEMHAWDIAPGMAQAKIDELNRKVENLKSERDYARDKATKAWEAYTKLDTENRRLERKLEELRLAYNRVVGDPPLKFRRIS